MQRSPRERVQSPPTKMASMADDQSQKKNTPQPDAKPAKRGHDDDVVGKVYDSRLMRRLFGYLSPYKLQAGISAIATLLKAASDVAGPYFVLVATDTYLAPSGNPGWLGRHLSTNPMTGITELGLLYLAALACTFALELVQTYLMQWTGQKIM